MATPMGLSCTLPPSCFTFFLPLLVSFVSRLGLVRLDSALLGPQQPLSLSLFTSLPPLLSTTPPVIGLSIARAPSLHLCPSSTGPPAPSPPRRAPRLSATRVYIGPARWGFRQNDEQVKPTRPPLPPQIPLEPARALTLATATSAPCVGRGRSERRGGERGGSRDLHSISSRTQGRRKPEKKVHRRVDAHVQEDLSKQKPGLSSSHVLGARRRSGEGGEMWRGTSVVADGGARGAGEEGRR